jgi:hypothetical protein
MAHISAEENWTTAFTPVNKSSASSQARFSLFGTRAVHPRCLSPFRNNQPRPDRCWPASLDRTLAANASLIINTAGPQTPPVQQGSAFSADRGFTFDCFGLGFRTTCFDGDLHSTFHRIFEGHLDSEQAVLVGRFGFVRFHRPT